MNLNTAAGLIEWILANTVYKEFDEAKTAARQFAAVQTAKLIMENCSTKDIASMCFNGVDPIDLDRWMADNNGFEESDLEEHFGID